MEYRRFGRTGLQVSLVGLGTGGPSQLGQKRGVAEAEAHRVVRRALDLGINLIDTAANYAESEAILGRALAGVPRDGYVLCTKFSPARRTEDGFQFRSAEELIASCEQSLTNLQTDVIDVVQVHGVVPETYRHVRDVLVPAMQRLQDHGKVRFLGLTESFATDHQRDTLKLALADDLFDTLLVGYNVLTPGPEDDVVPQAQAQDIGIMIMCAVRRKIGRPADLETLVRALKQQGEIPDSVPEHRPFDWLIHDDVRSVTDAAYKFAAGHPAVASVLTGTASQAHLEANVEAMGAPLAAADRQQLKAWFGPIGRKLGD